VIDAHRVFERGELPFVFVLKRKDGPWEIYSYQEQ
jgi:hypothetical protein